MKRLLLACLVFASSASGQTMYKCQVNGKIEYTDKPCGGATELKKIRPDAGATPTMTTEEANAHYGRIRAGQIARDDQLARDKAAGAAAATLDTQRAVDFARDRRNAEVEGFLKEYGANVWNTQRQHRGGATPTNEMLGTTKPPPVAPVPALIQPGVNPTNITTCDAGGCWDNLGNRYNGNGQTLFRTDGKVCQRAGTVLICN